MVNSNLLTQFVLEPTLGNNQLDLIMSDDPESIYLVDVGAPLGCSDKNHFHATLRWNFIVKDSQTSTKSKTSLDYSRGNFEELNRYLLNIDWTIAMKTLNIDEAYDQIIKNYNTAVTRYISTRQSKLQANLIPKWFNREINTATKEKYSAYARMRSASKSVKSSLKLAYNRSARKVKKLIADAVQKYEMSIISRCKTNPKLLYCHINKQKNCRVQIRALGNENGCLTSDGAEMANILNKQFFSVFSSDSPGQPPICELKIDIKSEFGAQIFSPTVIENCLASLDKRKPPGIDGLHVNPQGKLWNGLYETQ